MSMLVVWCFSLLLVFVACDEPYVSLRYRPRCRMDADCHSNAFCFGNDYNVVGLCKCQNGYQMYTEGKSYECLPELKLGDSCMKDIQCQVSAGPLAVCDEYTKNKICMCNSTVSHDVRNMCFETKLLNESCQVDENCLLPDKLLYEYRFAICSLARCTCPLGKRPTPNGKRCIPSKRISEKCINDMDCQGVENAVCRTTCMCQTGYALSSDGTKCLKAATKFGDYCSEADQCSKFLQNSICLNDVCTCRDGYHGYETKCREDAYPGQACLEDGDCFVFKELQNKVNCSVGVCTCIYGLSFDDRLCLSRGSTFIGGNIWILLLIIFILFHSQLFIH